jgi:hypothetical protein
MKIPRLILVLGLWLALTFALSAGAGPFTNGGGFGGGGGSVVSFPLLAPNGTAITPQYSFSSATTDGLYFDSGNGGTAITRGGTEVAVFTANTFQSLAPQLQINNGAPILIMGSQNDINLLRDSAVGVLAQKQGATAQTFRVYGTTTGPKYVALAHNGTDATIGNTGGGHTWFVNGAPSIAAAQCGTNGSVAGNDHSMFVTVGTGGSATTCGVSFGNTWTTAPVCIVQSDTDKVSYSITTSTTIVSAVAAAAFTQSSHLNFICLGR